MTSYNIRLFEKRDTAAVVKLAADYTAFDRAMPKDWPLSTYDKYTESIWVAEIEDQLIGFIIGYETRTPSGNTWGNIELLAVHPSHRRREVGTTLVKKILKLFEKRNVEKAYLHCPASALDAKKLYEKLGFEVNAYYMDKKL